MKILKTTTLGSNFTGSYIKKDCIYFLNSYCLNSSMFSPLLLRLKCASVFPKNLHSSES